MKPNKPKTKKPNKANTNTDKITDTESGTVATRRRLLKSALLGGGALGVAQFLVPARWTRPVVEAVTLPAHAATSPLLGPGPWATTVLFGQAPEAAPERNLVGRVADFLVAPAAAGDGGDLAAECPVNFVICISRNDVGDRLKIRYGFFGLGELGRVERVPDTDPPSFIISDGDNELTITGTYDAAKDRWTGTVQGTCPASTNVRNDGFTGQRIRVASAAEHLRLVLATVDAGYADLDQTWKAPPADVCPLDSPR
jgi:hypothetical protein